MDDEGALVTKRYSSVSPISNRDESSDADSDCESTGEVVTIATEIGHWYAVYWRPSDY